MRNAFLSPVRASLALAAALLVLPLSASQPQTFGAGVTLDEVTPIARLLTQPADFEGKTVRVEGVVTAVCEHKGCWMALAPETSSASGEAGTVRLKVDDDVIVFPVSAKGKKAAAQGVVQRVATTDGEGREAAAEHARVEGKTQSANARAWQIKATGAVVY